MSNNMSDLLILRAFCLVGHPSKAPYIRLVFWHPLLQGWIKVNTNRASCGVVGDGGCGGESFGLVGLLLKAILLFPLKNVFAFEVELFVVIHAIEFA